MIGRRNILELIGRNRGKYHSCILTTYSLDFSFFEERILPIFRTANIKNVNVFADGKFLEQAQDTTTGHEFKFNKTYNFLPVYTTGVFHPKIMLLVGVKHGLLIIGSGNITSSGLSTNDEIWGAFHLNDVKNDNASIFAAVWNYLQQFLNDSYGFINQKIEWIRKYSPWLDDLPKPAKEIYIKNLKQQISFIANKKDESIWNQLKNTVPNTGVKSITVISPYYDNKGKIIQELFKHFKPEDLNCIVDTDYGLLPNNLENDIASQINFYKWSDCIKDFNEGVNRLHAKAIHFLLTDGTEYMMLGSANATDAAMGTSSKKAVNHEAGILIKRTSTSGTWLDQLQIELPEISIGIDKIKNIHKQVFTEKSNYNSKNKIVYSELRGTELSIYTKNKIDIPGLRVVTLSREGNEIENIPVELFDKKMVAKCNSTIDIFKIALINDNLEVISNYSLVHRLEVMLKCNPDPKQEKLDVLLDEEYTDGGKITQLLQYVDYNWADDESISTKKLSSGGGASRKSKSKNLNQQHETLTEEEFNSVSDDALFKQTGEMLQSSVKIADFLGVVSSEFANNYSDDYSESEEQKLLEDKEQQGEGNTVESNKKKKKANALKERSAIHGYFKKLDDYYTYQLKSFYEKKELFETPSIPINIKALANILIGLQLIQLYFGKKFEIENDENSRQESYLKVGNIFDEHKTVKGFLNNVLGKFLLLCTAGFKKYDYDILNQKLENYREQILDKTIFIILMIHWKEKELYYRDNILLNTLFYMQENKVTEILFVQNLKKRLKKLQNNFKYNSGFYDENHK